jgi:phospholipid/cholesterol/gamma-HCH transport system substrate-binding protein
MRKLLAPAILLVGGAILFIAGNQVFFPHGGGYVVRAEFADASGLSKDSAVKVGGVTGGIVQSLALTGHDTALVTMKLQPGAAPIGAGATARIRPVNLLGENYVDLSAGNQSHPAVSGTLIPLPRTSHAVELDDVLNTLDPDTRMRLAVLINESGVALAGRGSDFNALLAQLPPSLAQAHALLAGLGSDNQRLQRLISESDRVIVAMNGRAPDLQNLVDHAAGALHAVANRRAELGATIAAAPAALSQTRATLDQLGGAASQLQPLGAAIQGVAPPLLATLAALPSFAVQARPALDALAQNAPLLQRLSVGAYPAVRRLAPVASRLTTDASQLAPVVTALDSGNVFRDLLRLMFGWARTIQQRDGIGHIFGLRLTVNINDLTSAVQRLLRLHPSGASRPPAAAAVTPTASATPPQRATTPSTPPPSRPGTPVAAVQQLLGTVSSTVRAPLQSTGQQLSGLLSYLLGR